MMMTCLRYGQWLQRDDAGLGTDLGVTVETIISSSPWRRSQTKSVCEYGLCIIVSVRHSLEVVSVAETHVGWLPRIMGCKAEN